MNSTTKKMKQTFFKALCLTALCTMSANLSAQNLKVGIKGGIVIPELSQQEDNIFANGFESASSFQPGIYFEYIVSDLFSIQPEFNYAERGGKRNGLQPIPAADVPEELSALLPEGVTPYAEFDNFSRPTYVEVPILLKFGWGKEWRFYANAGPYVAFLVKAEQLTSGSSAIFIDEAGEQPITVDTPFGTFDAVADFNKTTDVKDRLNSIDAGIHAGIGLVHKFTPKSELFIDGRFSKGFVPIQADAINGETTLGGIVLSFGYAYTIL